MQQAAELLREVWRVRLDCMVTYFVEVYINYLRKKWAGDWAGEWVHQAGGRGRQSFGLCAAKDICECGHGGVCGE